MKFSARPISNVSPPLSSIAARAARMRSTAEAMSRSGSLASPVESSMERPATPVSTANRTFRATPAASGAKPFSKSAFTGSSVAATISRKWTSVSSTDICPSAFACRHAAPELVVASALKPSLWR